MQWPRRENDLHWANPKCVRDRKQVDRSTAPPAVLGEAAVSSALHLSPALCPRRRLWKQTRGRYWGGGQAGGNKVHWRKRCRNPLSSVSLQSFQSLQILQGSQQSWDLVLPLGAVRTQPTGTAAEIRAGPSPGPRHGDEGDGGWQDWASAGALGTLQLWLLPLFNRSMLPFALKLKAELHLLSNEAQRRRRQSHAVGSGWDGSWGGMEAFQQRSDVAWLTSSKVSLWNLAQNRPFPFFFF